MAVVLIWKFISHWSVVYSVLTALQARGPTGMSIVSILLSQSLQLTLILFGLGIVAKGYIEHRAFIKSAHTQPASESQPRIQAMIPPEPVPLVTIPPATELTGTPNRIPSSDTSSRANQVRAESPGPSECPLPILAPMVIEKLRERYPDLLSVEITPRYLMETFNRGHTDLESDTLVHAYKGRRIIVTGRAVDISKFGSIDFPLAEIAGHKLDKISITLAEIGDIQDRRYTRASFGQSWWDQVSTLKPGIGITVVGEIWNIDSLEVWIRDCELIQF